MSRDKSQKEEGVNLVVKSGKISLLAFEMEKIAHGKIITGTSKEKSPRNMWEKAFKFLPLGLLLILHRKSTRPFPSPSLILQETSSPKLLI